MTSKIDQELLEREVTHLVASSEDKLFEQLGIRKFATTKDPSLEPKVDLRPTYAAQAMGPLDGMKALGRAVLVRWAKDLQQLICGDDAKSAEERNKLKDAFGAGKVTGAVLLSTALIGIGCPPALAPVVAAIVVSRFLGSAIEVFCAKSKDWVEQLS
jgi:hypothetical protein